MKRINKLFSLRRKQRNYVGILLVFLFACIGANAQNIANFELDKLEDNLFRVSIMPDTTFAAPDNRISNVQIVVRVPTGGFVVSNLTNLVGGGVIFANTSRNNSPIENPNYDYLSFTLESGATTAISFVDSVSIPLFTFRNGGTCLSGNLSLITPADPFYPINSINANTQHQLTILGFGGPDAPVGTIGSPSVADCTENCVALYEIEKMTNGSFQVSLTPMITYDGTGGNNRISNLQVTIKVKADGFDAGNIINLRNTGMINEVRFAQTSRFNTPVENPEYDYISFTLQNTSTTEIPFQTGVKVPLFSFNNVGLCTEDTVRLINTTDPFYPPNVGNLNADQQLTILGYGGSDAPVCVTGIGAEDCTRDCFMGCNDNVQVSLGINCQAEVRPEMIATAIDLTCPNGPKSVEILENGVVIPTSPFIDYSHIDQTFEVRVIDSITGNSCWGSIIVKDKTAPIIGCLADTLSCSLQDISPDNPLIGYPTVSDNCSDRVFDLTYTDRQIRNGCGTGFSGRIERTWTAVDSAGMVGTCVQDLYFRRQNMGMIVFPPNRDGIEGPIVTCSDAATDPANVGSPTINGDAIYPNIVGFCQLDAGFRDETVSFCAGNLQIIRTWTVVDACTGDHMTDIQIISVVDTTPPALVCPDTILASVDVGTCSATVDFPFAVAKDACSTASVRIETPFGNIEDNGGTLNWIPVGFHEVTYIAIDECNNRTSCTTVLHVADRTSPVAACDFINDVSLRATGTVNVDASVFDDGSRDDCSGNQVTFQVQRVDEPTASFADFVTFFCVDAGDTLYVNLRVTDLNGNSDDCVAAIVITNDTPPQITCPADVTISCTDDYSNLIDFGVPIILDDCGGVTTYTERDSFEINDCGSGRIIRTFEVFYGGSTIACNQVITIANNSTFDGNTIRWPANYLTFACDNQPLDPAALPDGFNRPTYDSIGNLCSRILVNHEDATFDDTLTPVGCYKILRTWSIIDWCIFNPNDTAAGGYWSHVQTIDLVNTIAPTFTNCPTTLTTDILNSTCLATVPMSMMATDDCTPVNELSYAYTIDLDDDGMVDINGTTNDATADYPVGTHRARFTVSDDCGNTTACNFLFTVRDLRGPIANCSGGTFNLEDIGDEVRATIDPRQLAINSSDNCTDFSDLVITASPSSFTCSELGDNQVVITITDAEGNSTNCTVIATITDTNNLCPMNRTEVNISGVITNEMGERVDRVAVSINHPDVVTSMTNENGEFNLKDVPVGNDYTILPTRDFDILNGISTFDLVLISRHILNIELITSPYRLIAADVNRSKTITAYDIVQLRRLILRLSTDFPNNTAWRFVRTDFDFENPMAPNQSYFPEVYNINDLPTNDMEIEGFVAVKVGDVNNSASTLSSFAEGESRNATSTLELYTPERILKAGTTVDIPIHASNFKDLLGFQFAIDFDPNSLEMIELLPNEEVTITANNFGLTNVGRGLITASWEQPTKAVNPIVMRDVFTLRFKVKSTTTLSEVLSLNPVFMKSEAYKMVTGAPLELLDVKLLFEEDQNSQMVQLYQNKPNPFKRQSIIGFEINQMEEVTLTILDITGKQVYKVKHYAVKGYNEMAIHSKDLEGKGVYYYQLASSIGVATKKMIIVE